jgi:hypothetical protein
MTTTEAEGGTGVLAGEERLLIDGELAGGGVRQSGLGRRYGDGGFEEHLEVKAIGRPVK